MTPQAQQQKETPTQVSRSKWGDALIDAGYAITPNVLIEHFVPATGLDSVDLHIVEILNSRWWSPDSKPMPSKRTMAEAIGIHPNTVRRRIQKMERMGLIQRVPRRSQKYNNTNIYLLDGLKTKLEPYAVEKLIDRKTAKKLRTLRTRQKKTTARAKFKVVT